MTKPRLFKLKRGFMATFAISENAQVKAKVYIASTEGFGSESLPRTSNNVSFIEYCLGIGVVKKEPEDTQKSGCRLVLPNWGMETESKPNYEYVPWLGALELQHLPYYRRIIEKDKVNHLLGFNASDNCNDHPDNSNLCKQK